MIPQAFITDLLARVDIVDVVGRYVQLRKAGANFLGLCPFHGEKSPSFTVSPTKQFYHCFGCGAHGTAISFLMELGGESFPEAVESLANTVGMVVPREINSLPPAEIARAKAQSLALSDALAQAARFYKQQLRAHVHAIEYLKRRGLTGEVAARFGLGYAPDRWDGLRDAFAAYDDPALAACGLVIDKSESGKRYDRFRDRIMFPIRNPRGDVIGFGGRVIDQGEPKYLNSPETAVFVKGNELYGLFEARSAIRELGYALVVEGYMDVVALSQAGLSNAVATLGTACTSTHVQKLLRQTDHVVFSFDGDGAGRRAAWRALEASLPHLADDKLLSFLFLPTEHDPDTFVRAMGVEAFSRAVSAAMPLSAFFLQHLKEAVDLSTAEGRARLQHDAVPLLKLMPECALRTQMIAGVAEAAQTPPEQVARDAGLRWRSAGGYARERLAGRSAGARASVTPLEERLTRHLLAHPLLFGRLDGVEQEAIAAQEGALEHLAAALRTCGPTVATYAELQPLLQATAEAALYERLAGQLLAADQAVGTASIDDPESAFLELREGVRQLRLARVNRAIECLLEQSPLSVEGLARYRALMAEQQALRAAATSVAP